MRMIAMLFALTSVASGGLQMAAGIRTNPDICPGRWDGERLDPPQNFGWPHQLTCRKKVAKCLARSFPANPGHVIIDVTQSDADGRPEGISGARICLATSRGASGEQL